MLAHDERMTDSKSMQSQRRDSSGSSSMQPVGIGAKSSAVVRPIAGTQPGFECVGRCHRRRLAKTELSSVLIGLGYPSVVLILLLGVTMSRLLVLVGLRELASATRGWKRSGPCWRWAGFGRRWSQKTYGDLRQERYDPGLGLDGIAVFPVDEFW